jgi:hypothetical protein
MYVCMSDFVVAQTMMVMMMMIMVWGQMIIVIIPYGRFQTSQLQNFVFSPLSFLLYRKRHENEHLRQQITDSWQTVFISIGVK